MTFSSTGFRVTNRPMIRVILVVITGVALLLPGCTSATARRNLGLMLDVDSLSSQQLGLLVGEYANSFADTVKLSASKIETGATELQPRRAALQWKIRAVPAVYTAASREDPLFGLADLWVLTIQQRDLFDRDDMAQVFGEGQPIARAASRLLEERVELIAGTIVKSPEGLANIKTFVRGFAAQHPIVDLSFVRASLAPLYIDFMEDQTSLRQEVAAVRGYADTALALALVGLNHVPEIARWQAELTLLDAETYPVIERTVDSMDALGAAALDLKAVAADLPATIEVQRDALLRDIERQRVDTLRDIELMRRAVFIDLALEREAVLAGFEQQMQTVLDAVQSERLALNEQLPAVAERATEAVLPLTREVIDHAFWRAMQLSALLAAFVFATIFVLRRTRVRTRQ